MAVLPENSTRGRLAITDASREQVFASGFCRMRLTLHTGRTHQIRVHLADAHIPILGDTMYARSFNPPHHLPLALRAALDALTRQALHAELLGFVHPVSGVQILCRAPLPNDLGVLDAALCSAVH
jgi:23S rRNA pseudouridine1911/1915/1917 synthase